MLIAVTNSDEINMMGCQIAYSLFRTPTKIARIRSRHYYQYLSYFLMIMFRLMYALARSC